MKKFLHCFILSASLAGFTGCGVLMPQRVEFFQKKVKAVPEASAYSKETERQAAARAAEKAEKAYVAASLEGASTNVTQPAKEAADLTDAVSDSLGPPKAPWTGTSPALVSQVRRNQAKLNERLEDYREKVEPLEGKKIEGTGLFSVGYFTMLGGILLVAILGWTALKVFGTMYPVVGLGVNTAGRVASGVLHTGFRQMVAGGEVFKKWVGEHKQDTLTKDEIIELFVSAQKEKQSEDVQNVVKNLLPRG